MRGFDLQLAVPRANNSAAKTFYKYCISNLRNSLPTLILSAKQLTNFYAGGS